MHACMVPVGSDRRVVQSYLWFNSSLPRNFSVNGCMLIQPENSSYCWSNAYLQVALAQSCMKYDGYWPHLHVGLGGLYSKFYLFSMCLFFIELQ